MPNLSKEAQRPVIESIAPDFQILAMNYNRMYFNSCWGRVKLGGRLTSVLELPLTAPRMNHGDSEWDARRPDTDDRPHSREEKSEAERTDF